MKRIASLLVIVAMLISALPALAQDGGGLSDEDRALLDRVAAANIAVNDAPTFVDEFTETSVVYATVTVPGQVDPDFIQVTAIHTATETRSGGNRVVQHELQVTGEDPDLGMYAYTISAESRLVDGVLYVQATRTTDDDSTLLPMPVGWAQIDDPNLWPALEYLDLDSSLSDEPTLFDMPDLLHDVAASVTSARGEMIDDGTPVDLVNFTLDADGFRRAVESEVLFGVGEADNMDIYAAIDNSSQAAYLSSLDADGVLRGSDLTFMVQWTGQPADMISSDYGSDDLVDMNIEGTLTHRYSQFDADLPAVAAPEMADPPLVNDFGLTNDELAQVMRTFLALGSLDDEDNMVVTSTSSSEMALDMTLMQETYAMTETVTLTQTERYPQGEDGDMAADLAATISGESTDDGVYDYVLTAEARLVDGVLYVQAARNAPAGLELDTMPPDGWFVFENEDDWPALNDLNLDHLLPDSEDSNAFSMDFLNQMLGALTTVETGPYVTEDGAPGTQLTIKIGGEGLVDLFMAMGGGQDMNETLAEFFSMAREDASMTIWAAVDDDGALLEYGMGVSFTWEEVDPALFSPGIPEGMGVMSMSMRLSEVTTSVVSATPLEPVVAPE